MTEKPPLVQQLPGTAVILPSGTIITGMHVAHLWRQKAINPQRIRDRIARNGRAHNGGEPGSLSPEDVEAVTELLDASPEVGSARRKNAENIRQQAEWAARGKALRERPLEERLREQDALRQMELNLLRKRQEQVTAIIAGPGAVMWRKDRMEDVRRFSETMPYEAMRHAKAATLEAVSRRARSWGFSLRHTSSSSGRADSRYLTMNLPDGTKKEVRLSDHEIPETAERFERSVNGQGPRWNEIVLDDEHLLWSEADWRMALETAVGLRDEDGWIPSLPI